MTSTQEPEDLLAAMVPDTIGAWVPPLWMAAVGDENVYGPLISSLGESRMSVPVHALRVVTATVTGMTNPEDGRYANRLREAHEQAGITPELLARVWQWGTVFIARADSLQNGSVAHARSDILLQASQVHGRYVNAAEEVVRQPLWLSREQVREHFGKITWVSEDAVRDFWLVADHPKIRALLPAGADDSAILAHCRQFLPTRFTAFFTR